MNLREFEIVHYPVLNDVKIFFVDISYRNMHIHKEFELLQVFSGSLDISCHDAVHRVSAGSFALLNPRQPHEFHAVGGQPARIMPLQVSPSFWSRFFPQISNVEFDAVGIDSHLGRDKDRLKRHSLAAARAYIDAQPRYELRCAAHINAIMEILLEKVPWHYLTEKEKETKRTQSLRLGRIIGYVEQHYTEKLLLRDLAQREGLSLHYLSRLLSSQLGMPFQSYLTLLRYKRARLLLERTDMKLTDIAYSSGFSDLRYLNSVFQERHGCDAEAYRAGAGSKNPQHPDLDAGDTAVQRFLDEGESRDMIAGDWLG